MVISQFSGTSTISCSLDQAEKVGMEVVHHITSSWYRYVASFSSRVEKSWLTNQAETVEGGRILNISIPDTSQGSHTFTLNEPAGLDFLATMYDAEGWGTGGTTPVLSEYFTSKHAIFPETYSCRIVG